MTAKAITTPHSDLEWPISISRNTLLTALVLVLFVAFVWLIKQGLVWPPLFPINKVQVVGKLEWVSQEKMQKQISPYINTSFFGADLHELKYSVHQMPWIKSVSVRRIWPDTLRLEVVEQKPLARWNQVNLINDEGQLFQPNTLPNSLIHLQGPKDMHQKVFALYNEIQSEVAPYDLVVTNVAVNGRHALRVKLSNNVQIMFGRLSVASDPAVMVARFVKAYKHGLSAKADLIKQVDLRYTNGFAIRWIKDSDSKKTNNDKQTGQKNTGLNWDTANG